MGSMKKEKHKQHRRIAWGLLALGMVCGWANAGQGTAPGEEATVELRQDAQIRAGKLESGLRYVIRPTKEPAGRGSVRLRVGVGSLYENEVNTGFSHLLEHMVFNGSRNYKRGELIPVMQKLGLGFGGDANAYTSLLETVYMLDLPNLEQKTVETALSIMRDFADGATLEDEAIEKERGIVISELKARDSASMRAHIALLGQLTEGTKLAERMPIGKEDVLRHGSAEELRKLYHTHYTPEKMTLVLTGDFDAQEIEQLVKKNFEGMSQRQAPPRPDIGQLCEPQDKVKLVPNEEQADVTLYVSVVNPYRAKGDSARTRADELPLRLACAMLERRLRRISHAENSPFTQANVEQQDLYETVNLSSMALTAPPEQWRAALQAGVQELRRAVTYGFSADELHEAADALASNLQHASVTWETLPAAAMADRLVAEIGDKKELTDAQEDQRVLMPALQRILQDPDLCRQALENAFRLEDARLTMMGTLPQDATPEALRAEFFDKALKEPVQRMAQQAHKPFAYETIGMPGSVLKRELDEDLGVTTVTLSNGVRVNLKPVDFRKGCVAVSAAVDGGLLALPDTPGLANMTRAVMERGGLQEHSHDELERLMASKQVGLNFSLTPTRFLFSGDAATEDLEMQCKLLAAAILYPGYRDEGERLLRRSLDNEYRALETTPKGVFATESRRAIFGQNPLFTLPQRKELEALKAADVQRAMAPLLQKNYVEVTLVGDFEIEEALPVLERTFGAMPTRSSEPEPLPAAKRCVTMMPWGLRRPLPYPTQLDKTLVARVHAAGNGRDERRNRRLEVLASILRNRLFNGLRATMGESYSPSVLVEPHADFDDAALLSAFSYGVQRNQSLVSSAMESICNGIGQGDVGDEEFELAIRPYRAAVQKKLITPDFWEKSLMDFQSNPERRALIRDMVKDVQSITAEEIRTLGRDVFGRECRADFFFVLPQSEQANTPAPAAPEQSAKPAEPAIPEFSPPAPGEYAVLISAATAQEPGWKAVAQALLEKYPGAKLCELPELSEEACAKALRESQPRYAAVVLRPQEITQAATNALHRAARRIDDDPYGDCIWGIVTGYDAEHALRIARGRGTVLLSRLLTLAQPDNSRFEHSCCMSEDSGLPIYERNGAATTTTTHDASTQEGQQALQDGLQDRFADRLTKHNPQLIISATPSTPFSLEMPLCKGLIFPCGNRFYSVGCQHLIAFASAHQPAMEGKPDALQSLAEAMHFAPIEPDEHERVWLALGPGAMGDARGSRQSMVITAVSAYGCHQFVGMTLPSWYGATAKNVLHFFMEHTDRTTLAEAVFLANQLLIAKTLSIDPRLLDVQLQGQGIGAQLQSDLNASGVRVSGEQAQDVAGMVLERDALVFYGDPARPAIITSARKHAPLELVSTPVPALRAERDFTGPAAIIFPKRQDEPTIPTAEQDCIRTENFLLYPHLELKAGEIAEKS